MNRHDSDKFSVAYVAFLIAGMPTRSIASVGVTGIVTAAAASGTGPPSLKK